MASERSWRTIDKKKWPNRGEWDKEPDVVLWTDPATGLACAILRSLSWGTLSGYVGVPLGHTYYRAKASLLEVSAHGGLNFSGRFRVTETGEVFALAPQTATKEWWLGFDCGHAWDFHPALDAQLYPGRQYRDLAYVRGQVTSLAAQLDGRPIKGAKRASRRK
jgi:hypothetical protein